MKRRIHMPLTDLLVLLSIIGILAAFIVPNFLDALHKP